MSTTRITAAEVRAVEFGTERRGYDRAEVDALLDRVVDALAAPAPADADHTGPVETIRPGSELERALDRAAAAERALAEALSNNPSAVLAMAHEVAERTVAEAKQQAAEIVETARRTHADELASLESERTALEARIAELTTTEAAAKERVRAEMLSLLDRVSAP